MTNSTVTFKLDAVGTDRLGQLAAFLDTLPSEVFDIGTWIEIPYKQNDVSHEVLYKKERLSADLKPEQMHACGTTACAFGWAAKIPSFQRAGLVLHRQKHVPTFKGYYGFAAASKFFHLDQDERNLIAEELFSGLSYKVSRMRDVTPKMVAKKIRKMLKDPAKFYEKAVWDNAVNCDRWNNAVNCTR